MAPLGTPERTARDAAIVKRRLQLVKLETIADEFELSLPRVAQIVARELGDQEREIAREVQRLAKKQERTAVRVQRRCDWCGEAFEITEAEARVPGRGRFCSDSCQWEWLWRGDRAKERRDAGLAALSRLRTESARERAAKDLLYVEEFVALLPRRLQRSRPALIRHMALGGLVPDAQDSSGRPLFHKHQLAAYRSWLENHPDARALRYNDDGDWADTWSQVHHGSKPGAVRGRYNAASRPGKTVGRSRAVVTPDEAKMIDELASRGIAERDIAEKVGVSRRQVRQVLGRST